MNRKTQISKDFQVTDGLRGYAARKWTLLYLPDVMLADFQHCFDKELGGNGYAHDNWEMTFKRYMREASPAGTMYKPSHWDARVEQARRHKSPGLSSRSNRNEDKNRDEALHKGRNAPSGKDTWVPTPTGEKALKDIRALLEPYAHLLK